MDTDLRFHLCQELKVDGPWFDESPASVSPFGAGSERPAPRPGHRRSASQTLAAASHVCTECVCTYIHALCITTITAAIPLRPPYAAHHTGLAGLPCAYPGPDMYVSLGGRRAETHVAVGSRSSLPACQPSPLSFSVSLSDSLSLSVTHSTAIGKEFSPA